MNLVDWYEIELALLVRSVLQYRNAQTFCSKGAILKYSLGSTSNILKKCPRTHQVSNYGKLCYLKRKLQESVQRRELL